MMKKVLLGMAAALVLTGCTLERSAFKKEQIVEFEESVSAFDAVEVMGSPTVIYRQADSVSVVVRGPESWAKRVVVSVSGGTLRVSMKPGITSVNILGSEEDEAVIVSSPDLVGVTLSGSGDFICESPLDTDTLRLLLRGSGDIKFRQVVCDLLDAEVVGSGDFGVKQADTQLASLKLTGSGDMDCSLRQTRETRIKLIGSGDINVDFSDCGWAECSLRGSGDIELSGVIEHLSEQKSGSGDIDKDKLTIKK